MVPTAKAERRMSSKIKTDLGSSGSSARPFFEAPLVGVAIFDVARSQTSKANGAASTMQDNRMSDARARLNSGRHSSTTTNPLLPTNASGKVRLESPNGFANTQTRSASSGLA